MKATITQYDRTVTIEVEGDDLTIDDIRDNVLKPLLYALEYHPEVVNNIFVEDEI